MLEIAGGSSHRRKTDGRRRGGERDRGAPDLGERKFKTREREEGAPDCFWKGVAPKFRREKVKEGKREKKMKMKMKMGNRKREMGL